jgi:lipoate-protein ligase A
VNDCRLIVDPPAGGAWNMAVDEALLADAAENSVATLRLYQWSEPTLSLGYFQRIEDRLEHAASRGAAVVRRQSGGGAIMHDRELTYSLSLPAAHPLARDAEQLYLAIHEAMVEALNKMLNAHSRCVALEIRRETYSPIDGEEPFLCFQRQARGDVLISSREAERGAPAATSSTGSVGPRIGHKIVGSAQRRCRGTILQHGSLLLQKSACAPELPGLNDLSGAAATADQLAVALPDRLAKAAGLRLQSTRMPAYLGPGVSRLQSRKYAAATWTNRR